VEYRARVKICGITKQEDAMAAARLGADAVGFVFADSPRKVTLEQAMDIGSKLPPFVARVGLFVNADPAAIREAWGKLSLDLVQLHGDETPSFCEALNDLRTMKAFRIGRKEDLDAVFQYSSVHAVLLDARVKGLRGGSGRSFPWEWLESWKAPKPWILAGGLDPTNVEAAISRWKPYAVDVSSGVESEPGIKSQDKIRRFMEAVHRTRYS